MTVRTWRLTMIIPRPVYFRLSRRLVCTFQKLARKGRLVASKEHVRSALDHKGVLVTERVRCEGVWRSGRQVAPLEDVLQHLKAVLVCGVSVNVLDVLPGGAQERDTVHLKVMWVCDPVGTLKHIIHVQTGCYPASPCFHTINSLCRTHCRPLLYSWLQQCEDLFSALDRNRTD